MAHPPRQKYQYRPLPKGEIRLIHLLPGSYDDDIRFSIVHTPLPILPSVPKEPTRHEIEAVLPWGWRAFRSPEGRWFYHDEDPYSTLTYELPPSEADQRDKVEATLRSTAANIQALASNGKTAFEALSYVWGDPPNVDEVLVTAESPQGGERSVSVTTDLCIALRHLRLASETRTLWVDAICIDQENDQERTEQVQRMADVYRSAFQVVVWLGPADEDSDSAMKMLPHLGLQVEISDDRWYFRSPEAEKPDWWDSHVDLLLPEELWAAIEHLLRRSWFGRLWVVQEIGVANSRAVVKCGDCEIPWYSCRRAIAAVNDKVGAPKNILDTLVHTFDVAHGLRCPTVTQMLELASTRDCTEPEDKIYGLLGFFGEKLRSTIKISYGGEFSELYRNVLLNHSRISGRLDLLVWSPFRIGNRRGPSWVPDWRLTGEYMMKVDDSFQAAGASRAVMRYAQPNVLDVLCVLKGTATAVFDSLEHDSGTTVDWLRRTLPKEVLTATYATGESMLAAWTSLLCRGCVNEHSSSYSWRPLDRWTGVLHKLLSDHTDRTGDLELFESNYSQQWRYSKLFTSDDGYIGSGPMETQRGDQVAVLLGAFAPVLVRPTGEGTFRIVGNCYFHGVMRGESLLGPLPSGWTPLQHSVDRRFSTEYFDATTGTMQMDDPRLGTLPSQWHRIESFEITADDSLHPIRFENQETGEAINYDPRMEPDALRERGVKLETISLV